MCLHLHWRIDLPIAPNHPAHKSGDRKELELKKEQLVYQKFQNPRAFISDENVPNQQH